MPKVLHVIVVQTDDDSFGLDPKLAYEKRVTVLTAKENITLEQVLDAVLKLTSSDLSFEAIRQPIVEPPVPLYKAKVTTTASIRDSKGVKTAVLTMGDIVSVYREGLSVGAYKDRAVITMPGVEPELNVWIEILEKING